MAEAVIDENENEIRNHLDCPVCTEVYRDPRILECAHHFCKVCLEQIAVRHPERYVICPTCRHVTKSDDVTELPRYRIVNDFISSVNAAAEGAGKSETTLAHLKRFCQICEQTDEVATKVCLECPVQLCNKCAEEKHGVSFKTHKVFGISPFIFCEKHKDTVSVVVCKTCDITCCAICLTKDHANHDWEYVKDEGRQVKCEFENKKRLIEEDENQRAAINRINFVLEKAKYIKSWFSNTMDEMKKAIDALFTKVTKIEEDVNAKLDAEIKVMEMMMADMDNFMESKTKLAQHIDHLLVNCTDHEALVMHNEIPHYDPEFYKLLLVDTAVELPELNPTFIEMNNQFITWTDEINNTYLEYCLQGTKPRPINSLKKINNIEAGTCVLGIALDEERERLFVRRQDTNNPITIFDYKGNLLQVLGKYVEGIAEHQHQGLSIDKKRDVLLVPIGGSLIKMDFSGNVLQKLETTEKKLFCVTCTQNDVYVASTNSATKLVMISSEPMVVLKRILALRGTFNWPRSMACGKVDGIVGLYVSLNTANNVLFVDSEGNTQFSFDTEEFGCIPNGKLGCVRDIIVDSGGQVLVCDQGNRRILAVRRECKTNKWQCLLSEDDFDGYESPKYLAFDPRKRILFVGNWNTLRNTPILTFSVLDSI